MGSSVMSRKNVTKVVWYILVQLSSIKQHNVNGVNEQRTEGPLYLPFFPSVIWPLTSVFCYPTPDTRNLTPVLLKMKSDKAIRIL